MRHYVDLKLLNVFITTTDMGPWLFSINHSDSDSVSDSLPPPPPHPFVLSSSGPTCDEVCQVVGGLAGNRGIPVISNGCGSSSMADRDIYPTFLRTSGAYTEVERFLEEVARAFRWKRLTVVHGDGAVWLNTADEFAVSTMQSHTVYTL